uniref:Uncharacterized protein n=1 Tax=Strigamia maritima TaxID=126957 RepID=T1JE17_STRMM
MDFNSLINLAKTKQHEPIKVPERKIEETNARLMTQAEKKRYLEEQARKLGLSVIIPGDDDKPAQNVKAIVKKQMTATKLRPEPPKLTKGPSVSSKVPLTTPISRERTVPAQSKINNAKQMLPPPRPRPASVKSLERKEFPPRDLIPVNKPRFANDTRRSEMNAVRHSKFANDSMNRQRAMNGQNERRGPPMYRSDSRPKRRFVDDDDEEDDEMDDFIDDGLGNGDEDYSKHIREIFGYDKRKYSMLDDDDCIESSFSRQMQEESYSARAGLLEDLEDIKREQEELERQYKNQKKRKLKL